MSTANQLTFPFANTHTINKYKRTTLLYGEAPLIVEFAPSDNHPGYWLLMGIYQRDTEYDIDHLLDGGVVLLLGAAAAYYLGIDKWMFHSMATNSWYVGPVFNEEPTHVPKYPYT